MAKSKIHITGDIHGEIEKLTSYHKTKPNDIVIIAGDFGVIWNNETDSKLNILQKNAEEKKILYLFIDGNHENFNKLNSYPEITLFGDKAGQIRANIYHLKRGRIYTINEHKFFCFGGATSIDKAQRTPYLSWWPEEECNSQERRQAIKNLKKIDFKPEYILTHTAPRQILEMVKKVKGIYNIEDKTQDFLASIYLRIMEGNPNLKTWFFGHFHTDYSSPKKRICALYQKFKTI